MAKTPKEQRPDFSGIPAAAAKELCRQGELCLQGTIQLAVAANQRATTLVGILGAGSVALIAATATISLSLNPDHKTPLVISAAITALVLYCGAFFLRMGSAFNGLSCSGLRATASDRNSGN